MNGADGTQSGNLEGGAAVKDQKKQPKFKIRKLEERIAPTVAPGQLGYEGQPGNQGGGGGGGGGGGTPQGLKGYEGQPGNQGG